MKVISVRNVPEDVYTLVKVQAATRGMTLREYVLWALQAAMPKKLKINKRDEKRILDDVWNRTKNSPSHRDLLKDNSWK